MNLKADDEYTMWVTWGIFESETSNLAPGGLAPASLKGNTDITGKGTTFILPPPPNPNWYISDVLSGSIYLTGAFVASLISLAM